MRNPQIASPIEVDICEAKNTQYVLFAERDQATLRQVAFQVDIIRKITSNHKIELLRNKTIYLQCRIQSANSSKTILNIIFSRTFMSDCEIFK